MTLPHQRFDPPSALPDAIDALNNSEHNTQANLSLGHTIHGANSADSFTQSQNDMLLAEALRRVRESEDHLRTFHVGSDLILIGANRITAGNCDFSLKGGGLRRLCQSVSAPFAYVKKLPPALSSGLLQYHLDRRHYRKDTGASQNVAIISRDGRFLTFGRSDLQNLTSSEVLSTAIDAIDEPHTGLAVSSLSFTDASVAIEVVSRRLATEVRPGDVICGGLRIVHDYLGFQATLIQSFVYRLVCKNGLVHRECAGPRHTPRTRRLAIGSKGAKQRQLEQVDRLARKSWSHSQRLLDSVQHLHEESVPDPRVLFDRFLRNGRLFSQALSQRLLEAWETENSETTAFGVLNALTRVATHDTRLSERQRRALAILAGIFAQKNTHICPHCFSVIPSAN